MFMSSTRENVIIWCVIKYFSLPQIVRMKIKWKMNERLARRRTISG